MLDDRHSRHTNIHRQDRSKPWLLLLALLFLLGLTPWIGSAASSPNILSPAKAPVPEHGFAQETTANNAQVKYFAQYRAENKAAITGDHPVHIPSQLFNDSEPQDYQTLVLGLGGVSPIHRIDAMGDDLPPIKLDWTNQLPANNLRAYLTSPEGDLIAKGKVLKQSTSPQGSDLWFYPSPPWPSLVTVLTTLLLIQVGLKPRFLLSMVHLLSRWYVPLKAPHLF